MQESVVLVVFVVLALAILLFIQIIRWIERTSSNQNEQRRSLPTGHIQRSITATIAINPATKLDLSQIKTELTHVGKAFAITVGYLNEEERQLRKQFYELYLIARETYPIDVTNVKGLGANTLSRMAAIGVHTIADVRPNLFQIESLPHVSSQRLLALKKEIDFLEECAKEEVTRSVSKLEPCLPPSTLVALLTFEQQIEKFQAEINAEICRQALYLQSGSQISQETLHQRAQQNMLTNIAKAKSTIGWEKTFALADTIFKIDAGEQTLHSETDTAIRRQQILERVYSTFNSNRELKGLAQHSAAEIEATLLSIDIYEAELRPYQRFGVKFMASQKRTLLGDAMGLGKTLQAIALATHLKQSRPNMRALVVCPASLIDNWSHEIRRFSKLQHHVLRGPTTPELARTFLSEGSTAIVSYETLGRSDELQSILSPYKFDLLIADEAHYIKNPGAKRTAATEQLIQQAEYVTLMTGTPLENRLNEMIQLINYVQPTIAVQVKKNLLNEDRILPSTFMEQISPVYLRRRTNDVLHELPDTVETVEWIELSDSDRQVYREAVGKRHYGAMRKAVTMGKPREQSNKIARLQQILNDYNECGEKAIIFSFYLDVLHELQRLLNGTFYISGQIPVPKRTEILAQFSQCYGHRVLLAQITSAGTGLNIQAASVVILMEPQFKPSIEQQAIARAHRMGQKNVVKVHRMVAENTVDERLYHLVNRKNKQVTLYADESNLKLAAPEATNVLSEFQFEQKVVEEEYARLHVC